MRNCESCGEPFEAVTPKGQANPRKRFCKQSCWITHYNKTDRDHSVAGGTAGAEANIKKWNGFESDKTYKKLRTRHEHRVVAEKMIGRPLRTDEHVHHIDGNKRNNDPSNLRVMAASEHAKLHARERREAACSS